MDYITLISGFAGRIADLATEENAALMVPSCPEWTLLELALHLGEVHEFWAANIGNANPEKPWKGERSKPKQTSDAISWCRRQTADLVSAISEHPAESPCWTWWEEPRTVGAIARHQVQEAAIHCWDVENAVGSPNSISLEVARDGIEEYIHVHRFGIEDININGIKFRESDTENVWYINPEREIGCTVTASASDLVLFLNGRLGMSDVHIEGERSGVELLVKATPEINY